LASTDRMIYPVAYTINELRA